MLNVITDLYFDTDPYTVKLIYSDGKHIKIDFKPIIAQGGVMSVLGDVAFFKSVVIGHRGRFIQWPNDLEFCADALRIKHAS